jgi:hypothetical protein
MLYIIYYIYMKKKFWKILLKIYDFTVYFFLLNLFNIGLYFLYRKYINLVLKYQVFVKTLQKIYKTKKIFCFFIHMAKSLKNKKNHHIVFHTIKKSYCFFIHKTQKKNKIQK